MAKTQAELDQLELDQLEIELRELASDYPMPVMLAVMEQLIEIACGTNPALKDFMRLQFYRSALRRLASIIG